MSWTLYADPGLTAEAGAATVLAAVVLPGAPGAGLDAALDRALRGAVAPLPWPATPEALAVPLGLAAALDPVPRGDLAAGLGAALEVAAPSVRALAEGAASAWALDRRLAEDQPDAWRALRATQLAVQRRVRRALAALLAAEDGGRRPWVLVAHGEGEGETSSTDALYAALETVTALLADGEGAAGPVHCLVVDPTPRGPAQRLWGAAALRELAGAVPGSPLVARCAAARSVSFAVGRAPVGGPGTPGGAVLAQWLRGQVSDLLLGAPRWPELVALAEARLATGALPGVAPRLAPDRVLPTVRALGRAAQRLRAVTGGAPPPDRDLAPPPWAPEATRPWLDAAAAEVWT